jgi:hypothetical protein
VLNVTSLGFDLSRVDPLGPFPHCATEGPVMSYDGDASITTNCPGTVSTNSPAGGTSPSHVVFTFTPELSIPHDTPIPPDFCDFFFSKAYRRAPPKAYEPICKRMEPTKVNAWKSGPVVREYRHTSRNRSTSQ